MVDQFIKPVPKSLMEDTETSEYFRDLAIFLDNMTREEGVIATGETTNTVVLTHSEKLDLITVTASIDLDVVQVATAANTDSLDTIQSSSPTYAPSNDGTLRSFNADAAAGVLSGTYQQAEMENIRDAVLEQADVLATIIRDLKNKGIFGV